MCIWCHDIVYICELCISIFLFGSERQRNVFSTSWCFISMQVRVGLWVIGCAKSNYIESMLVCNKCVLSGWMTIFHTARATNN